MGGHWQPDHCRSRQKLGIFIPIRNRWHQLPILLRHLHQLLVRQWRHYTIYVIEQAGLTTYVISVIQMTSCSFTSQTRQSSIQPWKIVEYWGH